MTGTGRLCQELHSSELCLRLVEDQEGHLRPLRAPLKDLLPCKLAELVMPDSERLWGMRESLEQPAAPWCIIRCNIRTSKHPKAALANEQHGNRQREAIH